MPRYTSNALQMSVIINIMSFEMLEKVRERVLSYMIVLLPFRWITAQSWIELSSASEVVQEAYQPIQLACWFSSFSVDSTLRTRLNTTSHVFDGT